MKIIIKHEVNPIKNGYLARSKELKVAAQGYNEETAKANLERTVRVFLAPSQRTNCLLDEIRRAGLTVEDTENQKDVTILLI